MAIKVQQKIPISSSNPGGGDHSEDKIPRYESVMLEFDTADPAREAVSDLTTHLTPDLTTEGGPVVEILVFLGARIHAAES